MDLLPLGAWVVAGLLVGVLAGAAVGWTLGRRSGAGADVEVERRAAAHRLADAQAAADRRIADIETAAAARLADAERGAARRQTDLDDAWQRRLADVESAAADRVADAERRAAEQLRSEQEAAQLRIAELKADTQRLADSFAALSAKALAANSEEFLRQAEERLKRAEQTSAVELAKREEAVKALVEPLSRTLGEVKTEMTTAERARAQAHGALAEQVRAMQTSSEALRTETAQLVAALRAPQVRGRWGELQLRRVVEAAGMVAHVDFSEQESVRTDEGLLRPDLVVHLPGEKNVVVDSKVAFNGYLEAMEATDETVRTKRLAAHARHVREHIDSLGAKAYWEALGATPEFVVMFVPAETFLSAALEQDPTLWERAFAKNVVIATPATLVALLRTVGYTWRQERLADEAHRVFVVGKELHKRLATFGKHLTDLGKRLNATVEQFNKLNRSIDGQLVTQVRRFSALQDLEPALEVPPPLEVLAVPAAKPDLYPATEGEADERDDEDDGPAPDAGAAVAGTAPRPQITAHPAAPDLSAAAAERRAVLDDDGHDDLGVLDLEGLRVVDDRPGTGRRRA